MNLLRIRMHHLIEQLADEELCTVWNIVRSAHYKFYMLKSIKNVNEPQHLWDMLILEEAIKQLIFL
jgi:hypothetical protein